jgi:hypothetical protein
LANHAFASCKGARKRALFLAFANGLHEAEARFPGCLSIDSDSQGARVQLLDPKTKATACSVDFWANGNKVEWRHSADFGLTWWFEQTIASIAARAASKALGRPVVLTEEGVSETLRPDFDAKYPRLSDWMSSLMDSVGPGRTIAPIPKPLLTERFAALESVIEGPGLS